MQTIKVEKTYPHLQEKSLEKTKAYHGNCGDGEIRFIRQEDGWRMECRGCNLRSLISPDDALKIVMTAIDGEHRNFRASLGAFGNITCKVVRKE